MRLSINYDQIDDGLWVGSYPQQPEDVVHLRSVGVDAILNLQSDEDLVRRGVSWQLFWQFYMRQGIHVVRVKIRDFDVDDLILHLDEAVDELHRLRTAGKSVYLHCTAGLNRSPTVAIAWLMRERAWSVDEALEFVQARRECLPYPEVLEHWSRKLA